jgi:hypothetical protein
MPCYNANSMLLHSPQWGRQGTHSVNEQFFKAVIDAAQLVPVSYVGYLSHYCSIFST